MGKLLHKAKTKFEFSESNNNRTCFREFEKQSYIVNSETDVGGKNNNSKRIAISQNGSAIALYCDINTVPFYEIKIFNIDDLISNDKNISSILLHYFPNFSGSKQLYSEVMHLACIFDEGENVVIACCNETSVIVHRYLKTSNYTKHELMCSFEIFSLNTKCFGISITPTCNYLIVEEESTYYIYSLSKYRVRIFEPFGELVITTLKQDKDWFSLRFSIGHDIAGKDVNTVTDSLFYSFDENTKIKKMKIALLISTIDSKMRNIAYAFLTVDYEIIVRVESFSDGKVLFSKKIEDRTRTIKNLTINTNGDKVCYFSNQKIQVYSINTQKLLYLRHIEHQSEEETILKDFQFVSYNKREVISYRNDSAQVLTILDEFPDN